MVGLPGTRRYETLLGGKELSLPDSLRWDETSSAGVQGAMARSRRGRGGRGYGFERREEPQLQPVRADLHVHTPFSADYQDLNATYLQILQTAAARGLDMIALTDHNTVGGITAMRREVEDLTLLEELDRLTSEEAQILTEYRRLLDGMLVLPGIEFTAAYGFHILGIFPPETSVRRLEHLLLALGLSEAQMDAGSAQVINTADVLTAYEIIGEFGGLVIPAHVDTAHGVAMGSARYGEQTRIAYTQSPLIAALEVTDLEDGSRRGSAAFFNGTRTDYPRQMHLIQGSNAHRLTREGARRDTDFGIGDRAMELMLPDRSFAALRQLFTSDDFARERPWYPVPERPTDPVLAARESGATITQAFHEQARSRRSGYRPMLKDVVSFANTQGGTIYLGLSGNPAVPVAGVPLVDEVVRGLRDAVMRSVVPRLDVTADVETVMGKSVIVVRIPKGPDTPYATEAGQVFVRQNGESVIALRDEIVQLVQEATRAGNAPAPAVTGERLWIAPRPAITDFDDEESNNDAGNDARSEPPRVAPRIVPSVPPAPPAATPPARAPTRAAVPPVALVAPPPTAPILPPTPVTPSSAPEPAPTPVGVAPPAVPDPVPNVPSLPSAAPIISHVETAPSVDTLVETVPGTSHPVEIPHEDAGPGGETETVAIADTTRSEAADVTEAIEVESRGPRRPTRRRPSRARGARSADSVDGAAATPEAASQGVATTETHNPAANSQTDALPVYSLETAQGNASPPPSDAPSVAERGIVAEARGEEAEPVAATEAATDAPVAAPRRRRHTPSKDKAATATVRTPPTDEVPTPVVPTNEREVAETTSEAVEAGAESDKAFPAPSASSDSPSPFGPAAPSGIALPTTGVEILAVEEHAGGRHYTIRDLTTGKITEDVTRKTARGPSRQAILAREDRLPTEDKILWRDARGFGRTVVRDGVSQHDLALQEPNGQVRIFYAVTNDGLDEDWRSVIPQA